MLSPVFLFAQSLTGLWTGVLTNDSSSLRRDQSFEIVLTEYRGKVYGYSRSEFIVNDTLYYIVKRVKGTIAGDLCEVKDDEILSFNFPTKLDKGIKVTSTFYRNKLDSNWYLAGSWKTNATKKYFAVTGKVELHEEKDFSQSKIFPHLEELDLANDVAFYKNWKSESEKKNRESIAKTEGKGVPVNNNSPFTRSDAGINPVLQDGASERIATTPKKESQPISEKQDDQTTKPGSDLSSAQKISVVKSGPASVQDILLTSKAVSPIKNPEEKQGLTVITQKPSLNEEPQFVETIVSLSPRKNPAIAIVAGADIKKEINSSVSNQEMSIPAKGLTMPPATTILIPEKKLDPADEKKLVLPEANLTKEVVMTSVNKNWVPADLEKNEAGKNNNPVLKSSGPVLKQEPGVIKTNIAATTKTVSPVLNSEKDKGLSKNNQVQNSKNPLPDLKNTQPAIQKPVIVLAEPQNSKTPVEEKPVLSQVKPDIAKITPVSVPLEKSIINEPVKTIKNPLIASRKSEFAQTVNVGSDSLLLSLYDNGEIDGDTVSVFLNGEMILAQQGLKASAIKKTIYFTPGDNDELVLVLYADNLGKYPPNTGLLVVHDGEEVYNIRFSADFQKNAAVVFRKKKK